jgi:hypothetical protein
MNICQFEHKSITNNLTVNFKLLNEKIIRTKIDINCFDFCFVKLKKR